jgi:hypothetical protein
MLGFLVLWMLCDRGGCTGLAMEWQMGMEFVEHYEFIPAQAKTPMSWYVAALSSSGQNVWL